MPLPTLTAEQRELLIRLVDHDQRARVEKRDRSFIVTMGGFGPSEDLVLFATGGNLTADYGDALELLNRGYLTGRRQESNSFSASVSPEAHEFMKATSSDPREELAAHIVRFVEGELPDSFAKASSLVREGTQKVRVVQSTSDLTAVGHKIREAMQEFSDVLYVEYVPGAAATPIERNRTRNKIAAFAEYVKPLIGETDKYLLDAIKRFWDAADHLAQKVEHGGNRESTPASIADGKRLVLLSLLTMQELARFAEATRR